jgi:hypothetical protein
VVIAAGTNNVRIASGGGIIFLGASTVTSGAAAGDAILGNNKWLRASNAAAGAALGMVSIDASNRLVLDSNSAALTVANATTQSTIGANGAASALTANPVGYIKVNIGGSDRIIPYYNP